MFTWHIGEPEAGMRIDRWLTGRVEGSRAALQREIREGSVRVNGGIVKPSYALRSGDIVRRTVPDEPTSGNDLIPEPMPLTIVHEDADLVVVDKPPGLVVYPAAGHRSGTLLNGLKALFPVLAGLTGAPLRPGVVHRLDKDTSGLMVIALTNAAYHNLRRQFDERAIWRRYLALITGAFRDDEGVMEGLIGRSERDRKKMSATTGRGKPAVTMWRTLERYRDASLVEFRLKTGRTHQIRVHCSAAGHPILGDRVYGGRARIDRISFPRQMLHAATLGFVHPSRGGTMEFHAPLPGDMALPLESLRARG